MSKKEVEEFKTISQKRNFFNTTDASRVYLWCLILPLAVGFILLYMTLTIAKGQGVDTTDKNVIQLLYDKYLWFAIASVLMAQVVFVLVYVIYNKINRVKLSSCGVSFKKAKAGTALLSAFVGIIAVWGFLILIEGIFGNFFHIFGLPKDNGTPLQNNSVGWYLLNLLLLGIIPPICEEIIFRGVIFKGLRNSFSKWTSILLTALLFALIHQSITQFIYPFMLGIVLTTLMEHTGNLLYPIILHLFNNITTITLDFLNQKGILHINFIGMSWWVYVLGVVFTAIMFAVLFVIYKFYLKKHEKIEVEPEGQAIQTTGFHVGKLPLTLIAGMALAVVMIVINAI